MKMNPLKASALLFCALASSGWSAEAARQPIRQIDRPMIPPKGMWQEVLSQNTIIYIEDEDAEVEEDLLAGFLPGLPSWSITDNLQWTFLPAPMFRYLITRNNINAENGPVVDDLSLTVEGGLSSIGYSSREGAIINMQLGMSAKKPALDWLWLEGAVQTYYSNREPVIIGAAAGAGFQITDRTHATATYALSLPIEDTFEFVHVGTVAFGANFTRNLSLELKTSMLVGSRTSILNPGANLVFYW
jgi:hypothetical protein